MLLTSLTEVIRGETNSPWLIDGLLQKGSSILLHDKDSSLALQLGLDVAGGKPFLGEYPTSLGKVLFISRDKTQLQEHARLLARRPASTDNVTAMILDPGDERELVRVMKTENPVLTILGNFPGSLDQLQFITRVGSVIALTSGTWQGQLPISDMWSLQYTDAGYKLIVKPMGLSIKLSMQDSGFVFESVEEWKPNSIYTPPKAEKVQWRNTSAHGGIGVSGSHAEQQWTSLTIR
ncbi:MAG TPA: AAA family ATPase [Verrucomicrobiae bacterium]|jgi:hypothetical protein|nr:AAA family ATPase [Verrucomicrobiae bacterium]